MQRVNGVDLYPQGKATPIPASPQLPGPQVADLARPVTPEDDSADFSESSLALSSPRTLDTLRAFLGLMVIDVIVKCKGFAYLHELVRRCPVSQKRPADGEAAGRLAAAVCAAIDRACVYYFKQAVCLQRSVLATWLLRRQGVAAQLVIGCRIMPYHGHAWVEVDGVVVNDQQAVREFYSVLDRL